MLDWIIRSSLRFRVLVVAAACVLMVIGIETARRTPLDVFPEFAPPLVEVQTEAPGLSTEEVESLVTVPLENALNGVPWLKTLRSKSVLGLSSVVLLFEEGTDLLRARQIVQERLTAERGKLPSIIHSPVMLSPLSSMSRLMKIGMTSPTLDQVGLTDLARYTIRPRLMAIEGVANVAIWGQRDRELVVTVDLERLAAHGISLSEVERAAGDAVVVTAGGFVDTPNQRMALRQLSSVETADDLARSVLRVEHGSVLRIGDVAEVREGHPIPIGDAIIDDVPGLLLIVEKQPWGNTLEVTRRVEAALDLLRPGFGDVKVDPTIFRPATFIERSLANLSRAFLLGCGLVLAVIVLFLFEWRTALISVVAIPLSLAAAAVVLWWRGGTLNVMTIAGLVIAIGEVVDDAIIDVENIARRLREEGAKPVGSRRGAFGIVLDASLEVRSAVVYASFIVMLVFVPVFFLDGLAGSFFRPLGFAYVLAIAASLVVALTVTPALSLLLLRIDDSKRVDPPLVRVLKAVYRRVLPPMIARPRTMIAIVILCLAGAGYQVTRLGEEFLPDFKETDFLMHFVEKPGTSLEAMTRVTVLASKELRAVPGVRNFGSHIGRAEVADEVVGPNFTELWISIDEDAPYAATVERVQDIVEGYPGLQRDLLTYLKERIKEVLTGASATIVVRVFGDDLGTIRARAESIRERCAGVVGVSALKVEAQQPVPQVHVKIRSDAAAAYGITSGEVRRALATVVAGTKVGEIFDARKSVGVVVRGMPAAKCDSVVLGRIPIALPGGGHVALAEVANVFVGAAPNEIKRESASRRIDVTMNVAGRDLGGVARDVEAIVGSMSFARGNHAEVLGEFKARQDSRDRLAWVAAVSLILILFVLQADFGAWRPAFLVFLTLPFALIGGVVGATWSGGVLSLGSLVGFVTVLGIAARNGILLISHYRRLERTTDLTGTALLLRGAEERLSPILMTALAAGLGLLPLVLAGDAPGHEIEYPLAVVILGGLVTSTLLNLLFVPPIYGLLGGRRSDFAEIEESV